MFDTKKFILFLKANSFIESVLAREIVYIRKEIDDYDDILNYPGFTGEILVKIKDDAIIIECIETYYNFVCNEDRQYFKSYKASTIDDAIIVVDRCLKENPITYEMLRSEQ